MFIYTWQDVVLAVLLGFCVLGMLVVWVVDRLGLVKKGSK